MCLPHVCSTSLQITSTLSGHCAVNQWRIQEFFSEGGVQQIQLRTEDRENGYLGAVAP